MNKKIAWLSAISTVLALGTLAQTAQAVVTPVTTGSNLVPVYSCTQVGNNVKIRRVASDSEYVLNSSCRDAGHGLREYKLTCTSGSQYRVEWKSCGGNSNPNPSPVVDNQGPVVSVTASPISNTISNNQYSYQVNVSAQDAVSNIKGILITVRNQATGSVVQNWWLDNRNGLSAAEVGFGSATVNRSTSKTGLQVGIRYTVMARAYDVQGNSTLITAPAQVYVADANDSVKPTITANVTYTAAWYPGNSVQKVTPTLSARATDTNLVTKITLYYNTTQAGESYSVLKTCNTNTTVANCAYSFYDPAHGNFYAVAWDEAGNSATSTKFSF